MIKYILYVKTSPLGLKYLGKTKKDPFFYLGSGKLWKRHLKKHNFSNTDIITEILFETNDLNLLKEKGIYFSNLYNVVIDNSWANLKPEEGDGGDTSKFINYNNPIFHKSSRSEHLNSFPDKEEKRLKINNRVSKIDYKNPERLRKIKENTNWIEREKKRLSNTDYSKFLWKTHEKRKKPVLQFDLSGNFIKEYESIRQVLEVLNLKPGEIKKLRMCLKGEIISFKEYTWILKNKN